MTLLSSNGTSVTHKVDATTAKALEKLSGKSVKVTTLPNGTIAVTPLVQTMTARVTAVSGNHITLTSAKGTVTQIVTSAKTTALKAGSAVTAVTSNGGSSVTLIATPPKNPLRNVLTGTVKAVTKTAVTIASPAGVHRIAVAPSLVPALKARLGKTVALTTSSSRVATSLVKSSTLNTMLAVAKDPPPVSTTLVATVTAKSGTTVSLQTADGVVHDALCGPLCANLAVETGPAVNQAYVAIVSPGDFVQQIVALPDESRMVGQVVSFSSDVAVMLLSSGAVVALPCDCAAVLPSTLPAGDTVLLDLDRTGKIVAAVPYPKSGMLVGTVLDISPHTLTIRTSDGKTVRLYCDCTSMRLSAGQVVAVGLNPSGSVASVAPLAANNRLTGQVLSVDRRVVTVQTDPRDRFTINVPPFDPTPPEGSVVAIGLTPDAAVQSVTVVSAPANQNAQCPPRKKKHASCAGVAHAVPNGNGVQVVLPFLTALVSSNCAQRSGSVLTVGVVNKSTGLPLPRANVALSGPAPVRWMTSSDGYVVFQNVPTGRYTVAISKQGYINARSGEIRVACEQSLQLAASLRPVRAVMSSSARRSAARAVHHRAPGHRNLAKCNHTGTRGPTSRWSCRL